MMQASISLTSSMLIVAALATVAVATEGNTRGDAVASQDRSLVIDHPLRASPENEEKKLILTDMRKPTMRDDRKAGDE